MSSTLNQLYDKDFQNSTILFEIITQCYTKFINDFSKFKKVVTNLNYVKKLEIKNKNIIDPRKW